MKRIPEKYWQEIYEDNHPSQLQRAWVQRLFELLDSNTSYLFSLHTAKFPMLIENFFNLKDNRDRGTRDFSRFIFEMHCYCFQLDYETKLIAERIGLEQLNNLRTFFLDKYKTADNLFDKTGYNKPSVKHDDRGISDFKKEMERHLCDSDSKLRQILDEFRFGSSYNVNQASRSYRSFLCDILEKNLLEEVNNSNWFASFEFIDVITQELIADLIVESGYSFYYLSNLCVRFFLPRYQKMSSFESRAREFLNQLRLPLTNSMFTVYLRIQAKNLIKYLDQFSNISFTDEILDLEVKLQNLDYSDAQKKAIERYFYFGERPPHQLIFALVSNISAADPYSAAIAAMEIFARGVQQAKFECELRGFSIDNRLCVHNQTDHSMMIISRKEMDPARYGTIGDAYRLERLLTKLSLTDNAWQLEKNEDEQKLKKEIVNKLRDVTLGWHKAALESETRESRFLNHWIGLEQLCGSIEHIQAKTSADKLVICLDRVLRQQWQIHILNDLWGDIVRSKILGVRRVLALDSGTIGENGFISTYQGAIKVKLLPEARLIVNPGSKVTKDTWIAGSTYGNLPSENLALQRLFIHTDPKIENLLFLAVHGKKLEIKNVEYFFDQALSDSFHEEPITILEAIRLYDKIEELIPDLSGFTPFLGNQPFQSLDFMSVDYVGAFVENLQTIASQCNEKHRGKYNAIAGRINPINRKRSNLVQFFPLYRSLREKWIKTKSERLVETPSKYLNLPSALICELFYSVTPANDELKDVILTNTTELAELCASQPLLAYRINEVADFLQDNGKCLPPCFIADLDRMRRARNDLVHHGRKVKSLEILTQRLYKYSRVYLREVIHILATKQGISANEILYPPINKN